MRPVFAASVVACVALTGEVRGEVPYREGTPVPVGYHVEERRDGDAIRNGVVYASLGSAFLTLGAVSAVRDAKLGVVLFVPLGCAGVLGGGVQILVGALTKRTVLVRNDTAVIVPMLSRDAGGVAVSFAF